MAHSVSAIVPPWEQVYRVGRAQRLLIWLFLAGLLALPLSLASAGARPGAAEQMGIVFLALIIVVRLGMAVAVYRVAAALGSKLAVVWAIGAFLPNLIGLIVLLVLNQKATTFLRSAGLKPGFMGVKVSPTPPPGYGGQVLGDVFS